jgi:hypothetical protein
MAVDASGPFSTTFLWKRFRAHVPKLSTLAGEVRRFASLANFQKSDSDFEAFRPISKALVPSYPTRCALFALFLPDSSQRSRQGACSLLRTLARGTLAVPAGFKFLQTEASDVKRAVLALATAATVGVAALATPSPALAWRGGWGWGPGLARGLIAGAVIGGIASNAYAYGPGYGYYGAPGEGYYGGAYAPGYAYGRYAPAYGYRPYYGPSYYGGGYVVRPAYGYGYPGW